LISNNRYRLAPILTAHTFPSAISALASGPEDIIWFSYNGHGYRADPGSGRPTPILQPEDSDWPILFCNGWETQRGPNLRLIEIRNLLAAKPHALLIITADSCNVFIQTVPQLPSAAVAAPPVYSLDFFRKYRGQLVMAGASPGEESWYSTDGGKFSIKLTTGMQGNQRWEDVFPSIRKIETPDVNVMRIQNPLIDTSQLVTVQ
jgi:hypothetical protein